MKTLNSISLKIIYLLTIVLTLICIAVKGKDTCPPPEDITPCTCSNAPYAILVCSYIRNEEVLKDVFSHSKQYTYKEVHIKYAVLKFLPKELFENTGVSELYLENSTFNTFFDSPPEGLHALYKLHLENSRVIEISHWDLLQTLTDLKILTIFYNHIEEIDSTVTDYITKGISQITFYATETKTVKPGSFADFKELDKFEVVNCKLKEVTRDIFPKPSNIRNIYLNGNEIKSIPDDMFTDMPLLMTVGLRDNLLTTIPESAFGGNARQLDWLFLEGNPLKCNCDLRWLANNKPKYLSGSCATPIRLHDKALKDLTEKDFKC